jgi:hypothetical protein
MLKKYSPKEKLDLFVKKTADASFYDEFISFDLKHGGIDKINFTDENQPSEFSFW